MGKLNTTLGLPKKILLQGWANDQGDNDINGEYIYGEFIPFKLQSGYIRQGAYLAYIYFDGYQWNHDSDDTGWINNSTNPNVLPLTGWIINDALGPAGTITPILTNTKNISIKKQNLTSLKVDGGTTANNPSAVYVFKGGSINTLANIFNPINFQYNDSIYITSLESFLNEDYDFFFSVRNIGQGNFWTNDMYTQTNMNNFIIPVNYIIYFNTQNKNNIQVSNGAIIQKYNSGKITLKPRTYLYKATGTGLSPNINNLRFYDSGLTYHGKKSFYSEDGQYAIWYYMGLPISLWILGLRTDIGNFSFFNGWGKVEAPDTPTGIYITNGSYVGQVTISAI